MFREVISGVRARFDPYTEKIYIIHENRLRIVTDDSPSYKTLYPLLQTGEVRPKFAPVPHNVQVQLTLACNFACSFCYANAVNKSDPSVHMPYARACQLIDILSDWGVPVVQYVGGEVFVHKEFPEIVEYGRRKGLVQTIITNGIIPGLHVERYRETLKSIMVAQVSMNALGDSFNQLVGRPIFDRFQVALANLANAVSQVWVSCVLTPENFQQIPRFIDIAEGAGVAGIIFGYLQKKGRGGNAKEDYFSFQQDADQVMRKALEVKRTVTVDFHFNADLNHNHVLAISDHGTVARPQGEGFNNLFVNKDGDIFPFPTLELPELRLGNAFDDDIRSVWQGHPVLQEMRATASAKHVCNDCERDCALRALSARYLWGGSFLGKIPCSRFGYER